MNNSSATPRNTGPDISDLLHQHLGRSLAETALIYREQVTTYGELADLVDRLVHALEKEGLGPGDRLALWLPNTPAYIAICLACARLGVIAVAINTRFRSVEVGDILFRSRAELLVIWPGFRGINFPQLLDAVEPAALVYLRTIWWYDENSNDEPPERLRNCQVRSFRDICRDVPSRTRLGDRHTPANMFTTSGTTKAPKLVVHRQSSIADHAMTLATAFDDLVGDGALLQALPFCGVFGYTQALWALAAGRPMVVMSSFDPAAAVAAIDKYRVRYLNATDDMVEALLSADPRTPALPSVRCCGFGSFNRPPEATVALAEHRGLKLVGLYGMSELLAMLAIQDLDAKASERALGGGRLLAATAQVRVRDVESGTQCPWGETGELEFKAPSQFSGYDGDEAATAAALTVDGFFRTGDLGYQTGKHSFIYQTRMGDVLRLSGFLVSPAEIEGQLLSFPGVASAQVVAVEWRDRSTPIGFVVAQRKGLDETALREHCSAGLAKFKVPHHIFELDAFPTTKSANGTKIQRNRLREIALVRLAEIE